MSRRRPAFGSRADRGTADPRGRHEAFEKALGEALEDLQEEARNRGIDDIDLGELRRRAHREQAKAFAQSTADEAERAYHQAMAETAIPWQGRVWLRLLRWVIGLAFLTLVLGANVAYGYSAAFDRPEVSFSDVSLLSGAVLARALLSLFGLIALGALVSVSVRKTTALRREGWVAGAAVVATAATLLLTYSASDIIADLDVDASPEGELLVLVCAAVIDIVFFTSPVREWWLTLADPSAEEYRKALRRQKLDEWHDELAEALKALMRPALDADRFEATLHLEDAPGLRRVRDTTLHVRNEAEDLLVQAGQGMDGGSIAISGPRGVGKTELLEAFCAGSVVVNDAPVAMSVVVRAPVVYDRREFMLHLFTELCEVARTLGSRPLRNEAVRHLRWIRYLQTTSSEDSWALTMRVFGLRRVKGTAMARQPLTYPEIVKALKDFLTVVAAHLGARAERAGRLVIGIDELDRIQPPARAQEFLNEIKVIFDVRNCLFILSVSDDALHDADLAPAGRPELFDSAVDEVIRVEPLTQEGAAALLNPRVFGGVPEAFVALFNCLAGGIPRDLLRIARAALLFAEQERRETLSETAERLVARELARITSSLAAQLPPEFSGPLPRSGMRDGLLCGFGEHISERIADSPEWEAIGVTTANRLFFLDTVLGVFSPKLDRDTIKKSVGQTPNDGRSFTTLATTGNSIGVNDLQARASLQAIRAAWGLAPIPDLTPVSVHLSS